MKMNDKFEWSIQALAQSGKVQLTLFPDYVNAADELALTWKEVLDEIDLEDFSSDVQASIKLLIILVLNQDLATKSLFERIVPCYPFG